MAVVIIILVACSAFFSSVETAFSLANKIRLKHQAENGNKKAQNALKICKNFDKTLTTILIGSTLVNLASSSIATVLFIDLFGDYAAAVSTGVMTFVVLTFGEVIPKCIAKEKSDSYFLKIAGVLRVFIVLFTPIVYLMMKFKTLALFLVKSEKKKPSVTEDELKYIIESIEEEGVLEKQERELVQSALDFDEKTVLECLTPRVDLTAIDIDDPIDDITNLIINERYSRLPVYKDSVDNIIGILNAKDYLEIIVKGKNPNIMKLITPPYFVYKSKKLAHMLNDFKKEKIHIAIVTDEYGGTLGIVTMEDLLEELVGDIWDEDEEAALMYTKIADDTYEINGDMALDDLLKLFDLDEKLFDSESISVGGFIFEAMGHVPEPGQSIKINELEITVNNVVDKRITTVLVKKLKTDKPEED
ncbi:MAG: hemolysin family protein [Bacillota bacterium]|nr:hemolysin family protein [Bacillota bacterium]